MAAPSRGSQISRRGWLLASLVAPLFRARAADPFIVTFDKEGNNLHVSSLGIHFFTLNSLKRLKDGSTVVFTVTVTVFRDPFISPIKHVDFKFEVSYDVWGAGNQFHIVAQGPPESKADNLSQSAAETWCFKNVLVPTQGMASDRQFWLQLDLRTAVPKLSPVLGTNNITLNLVELLTPGSDERQTFKTGPLRLADFAKGRAG